MELSLPPHSAHEKAVVCHSVERALLADLTGLTSTIVKKVRVQLLKVSYT